MNNTTTSAEKIAGIIEKAKARTAKNGPTKRATKEELHKVMMQAIWGE